MKNFLIIGGSSGIGLELAKLLSEENQNVTIASRTSDNIPSSANFIELDILNNISDISFPDELDGLIYCPGSINLKPFHSLKIENFKDDIEINYFGAVKSIQKALPSLKKRINSSIVLFSTVAVQTGMAFHSSISGAKGAVEGLTRALAAEFAPNIRVNAIAPSLTDTPLAKRLLANEKKRELLSENHPLKRVGTPKEIAKAAKYLLSEDASWITGQILHIDGGMSKIK